MIPRTRAVLLLLGPALVRAAPAGAGPIFFDSFDTGAAPQWGNERGGWAATDGQYAAAMPGNSPLTFSSLPFELTDFDLQLDVRAVNDGGVWLRADAAGQNGVVLITGGFNGTGNGLYWHTVQNGGVTGTFGVTPGLFTQGQDIHLRITVRGDVYTAYLGESLIMVSEFTTALFPSGRVGLYDNGSPGQRFDNVLLGESPCRADWNADMMVNSTDISAFLTGWLASVNNNDLTADFDGSGQTNSSDISAFLTAWLAAVQGGC